VIGTLQRGILATGLIKPNIPELIDNGELASLDFYFKNREGTVRSLKNFEGDVIFMNIWATWCPPCIAEMPSINSLYQNFKDNENVSFVLVSMDEDFSKAKKFMESRGYDLPIYHYQTKAPGTYQSSAIPTTYVISPDSKIVLEKQGYAKYDTDEFRAFLTELEK
jgi:thiol-disulfide isomerase/thioredoxin